MCFLSGKVPLREASKLFSLNLANNPNMKRSRCCLPSSLFRFGGRSGYPLYSFKSLSDTRPNLGIQFESFLSNGDAMGREPTPGYENHRFGAIGDYWESEISFLVRNSINQAGDDLVVSDTFVTREHNNRRQGN